MVILKSIESFQLFKATFQTVNKKNFNYSIAQPYNLFVDKLRQSVIVSKTVKCVINNQKKYLKSFPKFTFEKISGN